MANSTRPTERVRATVGPFFFVVQQQTAAIIQRLGKFERIAESRLHFKLPFVQKVAGTVNLRVQQLDVEVETKTQDNVFVRVMVSVQYNVLATRSTTRSIGSMTRSTRSRRSSSMSYAPGCRE